MHTPSLITLLLLPLTILAAPVSPLRDTSIAVNAGIHKPQPPPQDPTNPPPPLNPLDPFPLNPQNPPPPTNNPPLPSKRFAPSTAEISEDISNENEIKARAEWRIDIPAEVKDTPKISAPKSGGNAAAPKGKGGKANPEGSYYDRAKKEAVYAAMRASEKLGL